MDGHAMIAVPTVYCALHLSTGDRGNNGPWCLRVVSLSGCMFVEWCEIHDPARAAIRFWCYNHAMAPSDRVIYWHFLQDTKLTVTVKASLNISLPVEGNLTRGVDSNRASILLNKNA